MVIAVLAGCGASTPTLSPNQAKSVNAESTSTSTARFTFPYGVAVDSVADIYVADAGNNAIRLITPAGAVTTIAGVSEGLAQPVGVAAETGGSLYVSNTGGILKFAPPPERTVSTLASLDGFDGAGIAIDSGGDVFIADSYHNQIKKVTPEGTVSVFAGSGQAGSNDGTGTSASFNSPFGVAIDSSNNIYVADYGNNKIRKITPEAVVTTLAGSGQAGSADGVGNSASFNSPAGVTVDNSGNIYVADRFNHKIRKITPAGVVSTLAGSGQAGHSDGTGTSASFDNPFGLAADSSGNTYVADTYNNEIREVTAAGVVTTIAGSTTPGFIDGTAKPRQ
jgi:serine/threonine-protein kinase